MLIPIKYHNKSYPSHIHPLIDEIAGHFDISEITPKRKFSLHTEYSYGKRRLSSITLSMLTSIKQAHSLYVPKLWFSNQWGEEFARFVCLLCNDNQPQIIEIHPPFSDYTEDIDSFLSIYKVFEGLILAKYPDTEILIENRSGTTYNIGSFIVSRGRHLLELCERVDHYNLRLKIALDIPQLFTAYGGVQKMSPEALIRILSSLDPIRKMVRGIHLWGKKRSSAGRLIAHAGDLNTYFENDDKKTVFLEWFVDYLSDGRERYFVPEVNSLEDDLYSIVSDLEGAGVKFT